MTRILGLDPGERRIGVAVSDELGWTAQGVAVLERATLEADVAAIAALVERLGATEVVVGLPRNMDGSLGPRAQASLALAAALERALGVPVRTWDERLTTRAAERALLEGDLSRRRRRRVVDRVAAALILQAYLDHRRAVRA